MKMDERQYSMAGWLAIAGAVMVLPAFALGIVLHPKMPTLSPLLLVYIPLVIVQTGFTLYALYRLRGLLNDRYRFHDVDHLIVAIILGSAALVMVGLLGKIGFTLGILPSISVIAFFALIVMIGIPLSIVGIVFAVRLLRLQDDLYGLLKPFAYTTIAACVLYATILLAPLGGLVDAACTLMLGVILLRAARGAPEVEFV
jgi:hypothetical protein